MHEDDRVALPFVEKCQFDVAVPEVLHGSGINAGPASGGLDPEWTAQRGNGVLQRRRFPAPRTWCQARRR